MPARYWFSYDSARAPELFFSGDDNDGNGVNGDGCSSTCKREQGGPN
jgi:hypothetical protein